MKNILKKHLIFLLLAGLIPNSFADSVGAAWSGDLTALSIESTKKSAWIGVKEGGGNEAINSYLLKLSVENKIVKDSDNLTKQAPQNLSKIKLPKNIQDREIIGLAANQDKLLVVTQWTIEQGDEPLLHVYFPAKKTWKMIGKVPCNSIASLELKNNSLNYACENEDGQTRSGEVKLPRNLMTGVSSKILPESKEDKEAKMALQARIQMINRPL